MAGRAVVVVDGPVAPTGLGNHEPETVPEAKTVAEGQETDRGLLTALPATFERCSKAYERLTRTNASRERREPVRERNELGSKSCVPEFDPDVTHHSADTWLEKVEALKTLYNWSDTATTLIIAEKLQGLARRWYDALPSVAFTWPELKEQISVEFSDRVEFPTRMS